MRLGAHNILDIFPSSFKWTYNTLFLPVKFYEMNITFSQQCASNSQCIIWMELFSIPGMVLGAGDELDMASAHL